MIWATSTTEHESGTAWPNFYLMTFAPLMTLTLVLAWFTRPQETAPLPAGFARFRYVYLIVWCPAVMADWFQGPYVYRLYSAYGFEFADISMLFVAGFATSMVFGTFVGSLADTYGRKRCAALYCILYILACVTKHINDYNWLMVGRILGGMATSLLFSVFECWMVAEHCQRNGFCPALLRYMFGLMYFIMYASAIVAGIVAQALVDAWPMKQIGSSSIYVGGFTLPFDISMCVLLVTFVLICILWEENYGNSSAQSSMADTCKLVLNTFASSPQIVLLGVVVAAFEGSMFAFVLNWTPSLESKTISTPHGLVFSLFMMACMCGSSVFSLMNSQLKATTVMMGTMSIALLSLCVVAVTLMHSVHVQTIFYGFILFEFCVGIYFPAMGTLKSNLVAEEARAAVYNTFRVPLNAVVCGLLLTKLPLATCFLGCCALLAAAFLSVVALARCRDKPIGA